MFSYILAAFRYKNSSIVRLLLNHGAKIEKDELNDLMGKTLLPSIRLFLQYPCTAKGKTKSEQLQLLFEDYANPPLIAGFFPTTRNHYKNYAEEISNELKKPENKNLSDIEIKKIINDKLDQIPGTRINLKEGEFKKRVDFILDHLLINNSQPDIEFNNELTEMKNTNNKKPNF